MFLWRLKGEVTYEYKLPAELVGALSGCGEGNFSFPLFILGPLAGALQIRLTKTRLIGEKQAY